MDSTLTGGGTLKNVDDMASACAPDHVMGVHNSIRSKNLKSEKMMFESIR